MVDARQDETGLRSNTAIVFWGDHGYQLGEKGIWCKVTNFELATRVPLIVSIPGQQNPGGASMALVEHLDIYPTLADIAGIAIPPATMGRSMLHLVDAPASWSATARGGGYPNSGGSAFNASYSQILRNDGIMGYTMRTDRWRVTRWGKFSALTGRPDFESPPLGVELYDHAKDTEADFDAFENVNLATAPGYTATVAELLLALETTWDNGKLPPAGPPPQPPSPSPSPSPAPPGRKFEFVLADTVSQGGGTISFGVDADRDESEANGKGQGEGGSDGVSMCLSTDGATGVVVGSCGTGVATAEWVQIGAARDAVAAGGSGDIEGGGGSDGDGGERGVEFANAAEGKLCLNVYGGVAKGCTAGALIHLAACRNRCTGCMFVYNSTSRPLQIEAAGCSANNLCVSAIKDEVGGGGTVSLAPCAQASKWKMLTSTP